MSSCLQVVRKFEFVFDVQYWILPEQPKQYVRDQLPRLLLWEHCAEYLRRLYPALPDLRFGFVVLVLLLWISRGGHKKLCVGVSTRLLRQPPKQHVLKLQLDDIQLPELPQQQSAVPVVPATLLPLKLPVSDQLPRRLF